MSNSVCRIHRDAVPGVGREIRATQQAAGLFGLGAVGVFDGGVPVLQLFGDPGGCVDGGGVALGPAMRVRLGDPVDPGLGRPVVPRGRQGPSDRRCLLGARMGW
jgi:hypothetical protein